MSSTRTALVFGGGIAGPAAAIALQKAGVDSVVYEAYPALADQAFRPARRTDPLWEAAV